MNRFLAFIWSLLLAVLILVPPPSVGRAEADRDDERTLQSAGLSATDAALIAFFEARARAEVDPDRLRVLLEQLAAASNREQNLATEQLLGLGPLAVPALRRAANDSGMATQFTIADVNGDKLLDVITSNKKGVFLFEQVRERK